MSSAGEKALLVLPLVLFGVAAACELIMPLLKNGTTLYGVAEATYGFTGLAVVVTFVVLGLLIWRVETSRRRRSAGPAWV